jgi:hypothetical protein
MPLRARAVCILAVVASTAARASLQAWPGIIAPNWAPTWNLTLSTVIQPCNYSGFVEPLAFYAQFGIVDFDWSNGEQLSHKISYLNLNLTRVRATLTFYHNRI